MTGSKRCADGCVYRRNECRSGDKTPLAIGNASDEVITYGVLVLPGAMFMLAYKARFRIIACRAA